VNEQSKRRHEGRLGYPAGWRLLLLASSDDCKYLSDWAADVQQQQQPVQQLAVQRSGPWQYNQHILATLHKGYLLLGDS
jgi:hypothetical protein